MWQWCNAWPAILQYAEEADAAVLPVLLADLRPVQDKADRWMEVDFGVIRHVL
ncbi:hypothetical protein A2U01_0081382, partial [Trifolium medium]|nr:hypothetical protein [Trifolium medium]